MSENLKEYYDHEKFDSKTYRMLLSELAFERENVILRYFLKKTSFCSKNCIVNPFNEFTQCYNNCMQQMNKRSNISDTHMFEIENILFGLRNNINNNEEEVSIDIKKKKKKMSDGLDFPSHMYSDGKQAEEMNENQEDMLERNQGVKQKKNANNRILKEKK